VKLLFERVAGLDIGKAILTVRVLTPGLGGRRHRRRAGRARRLLRVRNGNDRRFPDCGRRMPAATKPRGRLDLWAIILDLWAIISAEPPMSSWRLWP
jgi:hypothetical protein